MHTCDWKCYAILRARLADGAPAVWNSLTYAEQAAWVQQGHSGAESRLMEETRRAATPRWLAFFRGKFTRHQFEAWQREIGERNCPACRRPL